MSWDYQERIEDEADRARYHQKLSILGIQCPYKTPAGAWVNNPRQWPMIVYEDIFDYLIRSPSFSTGSAVQNCKSLRSERLNVAGWVNLVVHYKIADRQMTVLKGVVTPSMNVKGDKHHPWMVVADDGYVVTAHCTCSVGTDETCSHVGGLLYKVEMTCRMGLTRPDACTDLPCVWNQVAWGGVEMDTLAHIQIYKETADLKDIPPPKRFRPDVPPTDAQKEEFLQELLHLKELPCVLSTFRTTASNFVSRKALPIITTMPQELRKQVQIGLPPKVTPEQVELVENNTRQQTRCIAWYMQREGRVTSSVVHTIMHTNQDTPADYVVMSMCTVSQKVINAKSVKWGRDHEAEALAMYMGVASRQHEGFSCRKSGLFIHREEPVFGASPDGVVDCVCCGKGVVEVKCPFSLCDEPVESWNQKPEVHGLTADHAGLKVGHAYELQVQHHLYTSGYGYCDYVVWTTKGCSVCRVWPRPTYREECIPSLKVFWLRHVEPELLTHEIEERKKQEREERENKTPYCPCGKADNKSMVGCDGAACPSEWFHYKCVGLKGAPKGTTWYCQACKITAPPQAVKGKGKGKGKRKN